MAKGKWFNRLQFWIAEADPTLAHVEDDSLLAHILAINGDVSDFDDNLHSLEALYSYMSAHLNDMGGLVYRGEVTTATSNTAFSVLGLAGYGAGAFKTNAGAAYEIYVFQADGAAPEGLQTPVVSYNTLTGAFTHADFITGDLAVGDIVLVIHPLLASLGTKADAAAAGVVTTADSLTAYVKQLINLAQLADTGLTSILADSVYAHLFSPDGVPTTFDDRTDSLEALASRVGAVRVGKVTTATSATAFTSSDLIGWSANAMPGWWIYCFQADNAAPEGEYRGMLTCSDAGAITHNAFSAQLAVGDWVMLVPPHAFEAMAMRGGAVTIQDLLDNQQAMLDVARGTSGAVTVDGGEDNLYDESDTNEFCLVDFRVDLKNMAEGDSMVFKVYTTEGGTERKISRDEENTYIDAQDPARATILSPACALWGQEGIRICAVKIGGTSRAVTAYWRDAKRGG